MRVTIILAVALSGIIGDARAADLPADIGAQVHYIRYEAESGTVTGGQVVGPNRTIGDLAGEASGRQAIKLTNQGDSVQWKATADANSLVVRYCIPDSEDGAGLDATLSVFINDVKKATLDLTSKHSWLYGPEGDPKNTPSLGSPRHIYDEAHALFDFTIHAGDRVMLKKDAGDSALYYGIDFVELEMVAPPKSCPDGFVDASKEGITPDNFSNKLGPLVQAFTWKPEYKEKKGIFLPSGRYKLNTQVLMNKGLPKGFEITGAGMWYTVLYSDNNTDMDWGNPAFNINGQSVKFSDFAMFGATRTRTGNGKPFVNAYGDGTVISRIWIEHMTCGFWVGGSSGLTNNLLIDSCRIRDLGADGINLCNGTKNSTVFNTTVRSSGDDGIAMWSATESDGPGGGIDYPGCANNVIDHCTVELPWRANAFAIYGGKDNTIKNCLARDTLTYAGINISTTFKPRPFAGTTHIENMVLERCGGSFWNGQQFGALWVMADTQPMSGIEFKNINISDATYSGIMLKSETYNQPGYEMNLGFDNVNVINPGTSAISILDAMGTATFKNSTIDMKANTSNVLSVSKDDNGKKGTGMIKMDVGVDCSGFPKQ